MTGYASLATAPNIFSQNAVTSPGTIVASFPPINGALYNLNVPIGRLWITPSTSQIYIYLGQSVWTVVSTGTSHNQPITWVATTGSQNMTSNLGYQVLSAGAPVILTLPVTSSFGDVIEVVAVDLSPNDSPAFPGFTIGQNAGQQILAGPTKYTTLGQPGSVSCSVQGASLQLLCTAANTTWNIINPSITNFTLI